MWRKEEEKKLIELYPDNYNIDIAGMLGKTKSQIDNKGYRLGLKKSKALLLKRNNSGVIGRVVNGGRSLTYETLKKIASKYKTKIDFIRGDEPAYQSARLKGYLESICSHMTVIKFSVPQLILREITDFILDTKASYNNRKVIKPYEIDVFYEEFSLGFEFQGIAWHLNNKNDDIKRKIANHKGITIIYINELVNSRDYEKDIKNQLIEQLVVINGVTGKAICEDVITNCKVKNIYDSLYNKEELIEVTRKYDSFKKFKAKELTVYKKLCKLQLIDIATNHMSDKNINKLNYSDVYMENIIKQYDNLTDFRKDQLHLYKHIKRLKKDFLIKHLKRK